MGSKSGNKQSVVNSQKADKYLKIEKMKSDKTDADPNLQKDVPDIMKKAAIEAVSGSKGVTPDEPKNQNGKGYVISGTLTKLTRETKGKQDIYTCVVNMVLAEWPSGKLVAGKLEGKTKVAAQSGATVKQAKKDAEACVAEATKGATITAIDWIITQP